jgi:hypothetical protein
MKRWNLIVLPAALFACMEGVESSDIRTSGVYPEFEVVADGSGSSRASARLKVGGDDSNTFLTMESGDRLEVTVGDETRTLVRAESFWYSATFQIDAADTEFEFAFIRSENDETAPRSVVALPAPFALAMATTEASRADDDVAFTWDPPGSGELDWELDSDCIFREFGSTPDDGSHAIPHDDMRSLGSADAESCPVELVAERVRSGSVDPAFTEGGSAVAYQRRIQSFTSTP